MQQSQKTTALLINTNKTDQHKMQKKHFLKIFHILTENNTQLTSQTVDPLTAEYNMVSTAQSVGTLNYALFSFVQLQDS